MLSRVRALSADNILSLNNQQFVDHGVQLVLRQLLKHTKLSVAKILMGGLCAIAQ